MGSEETGEFSLEVVNATLEDDAIYECQVGPSFNNKPIRASARLNVMCKFNFHVIDDVINDYINEFRYRGRYKNKIYYIN